MDDEDPELTFQRQRWEDTGDFAGVIAAFTWCCNNNAPLPAWVRVQVEQALVAHMHESGAQGRGKAGGHLARSQREEMHRMRWYTMLDAKNQGSAKPAEEASERLRGSPWQGTPRQMAASFTRVAALTAKWRNYR